MVGKPAGNGPGHGPGPEPADEDTLAAIERALVAIRRSQTRRVLAKRSRQRDDQTSPLAALPDAVFELLDAIEFADSQGDVLTVTEAAAVLSIDQPRASRLAAQALAAGLIARSSDQHDGRRSLLVLTPDGQRALGGIHRFRRRAIADATSDWTTEDRATLADLMERFVDDFTRSQSA